MSKQIKCILWGGYGWGNAGDELTLAAAIRDMIARFGDAFAILSPVPGYTMALFPGVRVVHYKNLISSDPRLPVRSIPQRAFFKAKRYLGYLEPALPRKSTMERLEASAASEWVDLLCEAELLYLVGGGYLTDLFTLDQVFSPIEVAKHYDIEIESAPLGIGPFANEAGLDRLRQALAGARIRVRDYDSLTLCKQMGIVAEERPDDGFRVKEDLDFSDVRRRNVIGINYYEQHGAKNPVKSRQWWLDLVVGLHKQEVEIEGFCFHNQISSDFSKTVELLVEAGVAPHRTCPPDLDYRDACRRVASYRGIVTCRFHAIVVANVLGVPALAAADGAYYTSKMQVAVAGTTTARVINPAACSVDDAMSVILSWLS